MWLNQPCSNYDCKMPFNNCQAILKNIKVFLLTRPGKYTAHLKPYDEVQQREQGEMGRDKQRERRKRECLRIGLGFWFFGVEVGT